MCVGFVETPGRVEMKPWQVSTRSLSSFRIGLIDYENCLILFHDGLLWAERVPLQQICC